MKLSAEGDQESQTQAHCKLDCTLQARLHCWHITWDDVSTCCWCGKTKRTHGPYRTKNKGPRLEGTIGARWNKELS